jgi:hypothetical protein
MKLIVRDERGNVILIQEPGEEYQMKLSALAEKHGHLNAALEAQSAYWQATVNELQ